MAPVQAPTLSAEQRRLPDERLHQEQGGGIYLMTATRDLHDIADRLDGVLHGALWPTSIRCSTVAGRACDELAEQLRARLYAAWSENCTLRARVARLAADNEGQRAMNAKLTEEALEREQEGLDRDFCT